MRSAGKQLSLFRGECEDAPLVVLNTVHGEGEKVYGAIKAVTDADFSLVCIGGLNWDHDMSPWYAPPLSKDDSPCTGGADEYLDSLVGEIVPDAVAEMGISPLYKVLAGYSLAGLFAVYSIYRTDMFSRIASASGSFWFPEFVELVEEREPLRLPDSIYVSLGDMEAKTRNQVLSTVESCTRRISEIFIDKGVDTRFEMNPGNHFKDPVQRMAKGISWTLDSSQISVGKL